MIHAVYFKRTGRLGEALLSLLSETEREHIRGLGEVYVYEGPSSTVYFVPLQRDFSFNGREVERAFTNAVGPPKVQVSLVESENVFLYPTGNITRSNPLLHPSFTPRTVSPVDADFLGTFYTALVRAGVNASIVAVHDPPSDLSYPHVRVETPPQAVETLVPALLAAIRKKKVFVPYVTVSRGYTASYFKKHIFRRRAPAYHVPYYWAHFLDLEMFEQMREKSGVRKVLVQEGLVLPGELPQEEV